LKIFGVLIVEKPAQPGFRRRTDGPYTWITFPKASILSNPRMAVTFTALHATAQRTHRDRPIPDLSIEATRAELTPAAIEAFLG
jgi:hypothetical protein